MNAIVYTHLPEVIGLTILHSLWEVTLLWILLVAALRIWPQASSPMRYALALGTLVLCLVFAGATALYEWETLKPVQRTGQLTTGFTALPKITAGLTQKTTWAGFLHTVDSAAPWLAWLWFAGLAFMAMRFAGSFYYLKLLRRPASLIGIDEPWQHRFEELTKAVGLNHKVILAASERITSPLTMGNLSPIVLLPAGLIAGLSTSQLEAILVHELYHIKRRDYLVNILQALVEVLMFYHPALWHISSIVREERENCCDDLTLALCGDPVPYARALTQIHETNSLTKPTLAMSVTGPTGSFATRIKRLFHIYPNPARARSKGLFAIGLLLCCMGLLLMSANALPISFENTTHAFTSTDAIRTTGEITIAKPNSVNTNGKEAKNGVAISTTKAIKADRAYPDKKITHVTADTVRRDTVTMRADTIKLVLTDNPSKDTYVIDEKSATKAEVDKIDPANIATVNVRKGKTENAKSGKDAHGDVVEIVTMKQAAKGEIPAKVYIVDDKYVTKAEANRIDPVYISTVNVVKGEAAVARYGADAKEGVIEIRTDKANAKPKLSKVVADKPAVETKDQKLTEKRTLDYKIAGRLTVQPVYVVNGVQTGSYVLQQIDPNTIQSINVYKDKQAVDTYGPDGANGVINIQLKPGIEFKPFKPLKLELAQDTYKTDGNSYKVVEDTYKIEGDIHTTEKDAYKYKTEGDSYKVEGDLRKTDGDTYKTDADNYKAEMEVYPNAANRTATVKFSFNAPSKGAPVTISLVNSEGSVQIVNGTYDTGTHEALIDVSNLKRGIYFVQVTIGKTKLQERLVVE